MNAELRTLNGVRLALPSALDVRRWTFDVPLPLGVPAGRGGRAQRRGRRPAVAAFTMVELLLVLVILATLAAIVVPKFAGRSEQARVTAAQTEISGVEVALDAFEVDNGFYPEGANGLAALMEQPKDTPNWHGPYLKKAVGLDPWHNAYVYECPGRHNVKGYDLMSMGPDGRVGGGDDITNWKE